MVRVFSITVESEQCEVVDSVTHEISSLAAAKGCKMMHYDGYSVFFIHPGDQTPSTMDTAPSLKDAARIASEWQDDVPGGWFVVLPYGHPHAKILRDWVDPPNYAADIADICALEAWRYDANPNP